MGEKKMHGPFSSLVRLKKLQELATQKHQISTCADRSCKFLQPSEGIYRVRSKSRSRRSETYLLQRSYLVDAAWPTPTMYMLCGLPTALSVMLTYAHSGPICVAVNVT